MEWAGNPVFQYQISDIDTSGSTQYFGFVSAIGSWYIMQSTSSGAYRYVNGNTGYSTAWTNRATQTYDYYGEVF